MNADLKGLISAILNDFIDARFQADVAAAELAEHYRRHPSLRALRVPSLNVTSVNVDLRFVFAPDETEAASPPQPTAVDIARDVASSVRVAVVRSPPPLGSPLSEGDAESFERSLAERLSAALTAADRLPITGRSAALEGVLREALADIGMASLRPPTARRIEEIVALASARLGAAERVATMVRPKLRTAPDAVASVNPEALSRITFTIDLDARRWQEVDDHGDDGISDVLTDQ